LRTDPLLKAKEVWMNEVIEQAPAVQVAQGSETMLAPQEVQKMLALSALGWGAKRIVSDRHIPAGRESAYSGQLRPASATAGVGINRPAQCRHKPATA
jgi:hypothetical protein